MTRCPPSSGDWPSCAVVGLGSSSTSDRSRCRHDCIIRLMKIDRAADRRVHRRAAELFRIDRPARSPP